MYFFGVRECSAWSNSLSIDTASADVLFRPPDSAEIPPKGVPELDFLPETVRFRGELKTFSVNMEPQQWIRMHVSWSFSADLMFAEVGQHSSTMCISCKESADDARNLRYANKDLYGNCRKILYRVAIRKETVGSR